jgi:hypothetical protein
MAGWWYGVVGHLELCNGNENSCSCHISGELINEYDMTLVRILLSIFTYFLVMEFLILVLFLHSS